LTQTTAAAAYVGWGTFSFFQKYSTNFPSFHFPSGVGANVLQIKRQSAWAWPENGVLAQKGHGGWLKIQMLVF